MTESGRVNVVLEQDCKCILLSIASEHSLLLILFSEKECICQISDLMPCTQGCVKLLQYKYHGSDWGYYLVEFALVDYIIQDLSGFCRGQCDKLKGNMTGTIFRS